MNILYASRKTLLLSLLLTLFFCQIKAQSYCTPEGSGLGIPIRSFTTTGGATNINNSTGYSSGGYGDFSGTHSAVISAGQTLSFSATCTSANSKILRVWVDYDKNYDFSSSEMVHSPGATSETIYNGSFTIPANTPAGSYRMRVILSVQSLYSNDPCRTTITGEAEDYTLTVTNTNVNIPDANFKAYLVGNTDINTNGDTEIQASEAAAFTGRIDCNTKNIADLTGIEAFVNLTELSCYDNQLTGLDVSKNTALLVLLCQNNLLTSLDVSKNAVLRYLACRTNKLTTLDVTKNTALTVLYCDTNQLTNLDITKNTTLTFLSCGGNQLTTLDVSKNTALTNLLCNYSQLAKLDVSNNTALTDLYCNNNQLTSLNLKNGNNTALTNMSANGNNLTCIQVDNVANATEKPNWKIDATASYSASCSISPNDNNVIYVDVNVSAGIKTGNTWVNAIPQLADVLKWAKEQYDINNTIFDTNPLKIYVAKGTYKPIYRADNLLGTNPQDRENAFVLVPNVQLYGGFDPAAGITELSHNRILPGSVIDGSILSGDIDGVTGLSATDALHVVVSAGNVGTAKLDGFTISGGYTELNSSSISVNGVNIVRERGAALSVTSSSPQINLVKFKGNYAYAGVVGHSNGSSPIYTNVLMTGNTVGFGTVYSSASNPVFVNTTIAGNTADNNSSNGVAMRNVTSNPKLYNTIVWGNRNANLSTNNIFNSSGGTPSAPEYYHSLVQDITTSTNGNLNGNTNPLFTDVNSDFTLQNASPLIAKGSNSHFTGLTSNSKDLAGNPRVYNNSNGGTIDMGAYEYQGFLPQSISFNALSEKGSTDANFNLTATASSGLAVNFTSSNTNVATISESTVSILSSGTINITAEQAGNGNYAAATSVSQQLKINLTVVPATDNVIYVNNSTLTNGDGSSWANPIKELADVLKWARQQYDANNAVFSAVPLKIYVAKGTYKPLYRADNLDGSNPTDRENAFVLVPNVQLYGGFDPTKSITNLTHARIIPSELGAVAGGTVLSGDFTGNDALAGSGGNLAITNNGENAYHVMISAGNMGVALVNGLGITGGNANDGTKTVNVNGNTVAHRDGGGWYNASNLAISNVSIEGCGAVMGGGVYSISGSPVINHNLIGRNLASNSGGGWYIAAGSPVINYTYIINNRVNATSTVYGGGMYNDSNSPIIINNSRINTNDASSSAEVYGGGIYNAAYGSLALDNVQINDNNVYTSANAVNLYAYGGGVYNGANSKITLTNVQIRGNYLSAWVLNAVGYAYGGGLYNSSRVLAELINVDISNNTAKVSSFVSTSSVSNGGGVFNSSNTTFILTNGNIVGNKISASYVTNLHGGGISNHSQTSTKIYNSIIFNNQKNGNNYAGSDIQGGTNIIKNSITQLYTTGNTSDENKEGADPLFVSATDFNLKEGSPAINSGNNLYVVSETDFNGTPRIRNNTVDMGVYEVQDGNTPVALFQPDANNIIYVNQNTSIKNGDGFSWDNPIKELSLALKKARIKYDLDNTMYDTNPLKIFVAAGTYKPAYSAGNLDENNPTNRKNAFVLVPNVQLYGGFNPPTVATLTQTRVSPLSNGTTLSGDIDGVSGLSASDAYHVVISAGNVGTALLDGFAIRGGYNNAADGNTHITVNGNSVRYERGSAITFVNSSPKLNNLLVRGNMGYAGTISHVNSSPGYTNLLVVDNTSAYGAVYNSSSSPTFVNSTFSGNKGTDNAGVGVAIRNVTSFPKFYNSIIWGNQNANGTTNNIFNSGGANPTSTPEFYTSIVEGNSAGWGSFGINGGNNIDANPMFTNASNGNYSLQATSPAIAKGNNTHFSGLAVNTRDIAANSRVFGLGTQGTIDIGAYEYQGRLPQSISFIALTGKSIGDADFDLIATASSGLPVSFSSANTSVATISGSTVNIKNAGNAEITASQAGNGNYAAATAVKQTLYIAGTLPVTLVSFSAKLENNWAKLQWQTANEQSNKGFEIYRSGDDKQFEKIGEVGAHILNLSYTFYDKVPLLGNNYYQLVQVDHSGKKTELGIDKVSFNLQTTNFQVYPNPAIDKINLSFNADKYQRLIVTDVNGKILQHITLRPADFQYVLNLEKYPTGVYLIKVEGKDTQVHKIIKH